MKHGGKRTGAGRKMLGDQALTERLMVRLSTQTLLLLKLRAKKCGVAPSTAARDIIAAELDGTQTPKNF